MYDKYNAMRDQARQRLADALGSAYSANQGLTNRNEEKAAEGGIASGALSGAALGMMTGNPYGALVGGLIGGGAGLFGSMDTQMSHGKGFFDALGSSITGGITQAPNAVMGSPALPLLAQQMGQSSAPVATGTSTMMGSEMAAPASVTPDISFTPRARLGR